MWSLDDGVHEGYAAAIAPDGRLSGSSSGAGWFFKGISGKYPRDTLQRDQEIIPDRDIIGWRGSCMCGWAGEPFSRAATRELADVQQRSEYVPFDGFADPSQRITDMIHDEWRAHTSPVVAHHAVEDAAREYRQAKARLDNAVTAAKTAGTSWADIGTATHLTRQAAQQRWGKTTR